MKLIKTSKTVVAGADTFNKIERSLYLHISHKLLNDDKEIKKEVYEEMEEYGGKTVEAYEIALKVVCGELDLKAGNMATNWAHDISNEIDAIGVPYVFEELTGAQGIAMHGQCVIDNSVLKKYPSDLMFVLFHELAHFYQYRKYGDDFAMSIYTNDPAQLEEDIDRLMWIEQTANKFARMKTMFYLNKYGFDFQISDTQGAMYNSRDYIGSYIMYMKRLVAKMPPEQVTIDGINQMLYNFLKGQRP